MKKKIICFTQHDLDGFVSMMIIKWAYPKCHFEFIPTNLLNFKGLFMDWSNKNDIKSYHKIFVTNLDISSCSEIIDCYNAHIIDHHHTHVENQYYLKATARIQNYSSSSLLVAHELKEMQPFDDEYGKFPLELNTAQKLLVLLADDFCSYQRKYKSSTILNTLFWQTQKRFSYFYNRYANGFVPLSSQEKNLVKLHRKEWLKIKNNLEFFIVKNYKFNEEKYSILSTYVDKYLNETENYIFENFDVDIACLVNLNTQYVYWRRKENCSVDLSKLAEKLSEGGGHPYSAGGTICDSFLKFTKKLNPIEESKLKKREL